MTARNEDFAANPRVVVARFPIREIAAIVALVLSSIGALTAGMQWAISNNLGPLSLAIQSLESQIQSLGSQVQIVDKNVNVLHGEFRELRAEVEANRDQIAELRVQVAENRSQIVDLRERMAKVETGLEQVQANQVRMLEILERGPLPGE